MSDHLSGVASVTARLNEIQARVAALTGDAIVPSGVSGVYVTGAQAAGGGPPASCAGAREVARRQDGFSTAT